MLLDKELVEENQVLYAKKMVLTEKVEECFKPEEDTRELAILYEMTGF